MDEVTALEMHRGISHSIFFSLIMAPIFGYLIKRFERTFLALFFVAMMAVFFLGSDGTLGKVASIAVLLCLLFAAYKLKPNPQDFTSWDWTKLMFWGLITHPLLDAHTTWGTQLFWPLDNRIAYKNIFVADPLYTIPFLVFLILAILQKRGSVKRRRYNNLGLTISSFYMAVTIAFKGIGYYNFIDSLEQQGIEYTEVKTRPTPFNSILWSANVDAGDAYYVGFYSLLDKGNDIDFIRFEKNHEALGVFAEEDKVKRLIKISKGWFIVKPIAEDKILYSDLRFGQTGDGKDEPFVFSYEIWFDDLGKFK